MMFELLKFSDFVWWNTFCIVKERKNLPVASFWLWDLQMDEVKDSALASQSGLALWGSAWLLEIACESMEMRSGLVKVSMSGLVLSVEGMGAQCLLLE